MCLGPSEVTPGRFCNPLNVDSTASAPLMLGAILMVMVAWVSRIGMSLLVFIFGKRSGGKWIVINIKALPITVRPANKHPVNKHILPISTEDWGKKPEPTRQIPPNLPLNKHILQISTVDSVHRPSCLFAGLTVHLDSSVPQISTSILTNVYTDEYWIDFDK